VHEVVDLHGSADASGAESTAIDRDVGADLDVVLDHHGSALRDLLPPFLRRLETETVGTDDAAGVDETARADLDVRVGDDARMQDGSFPHSNAVGERHARMQHGERVHARSGPDDDVSSDAGTGRHTAVGSITAVGWFPVEPAEAARTQATWARDWDRSGARGVAVPNLDSSPTRTVPACVVSRRSPYRGCERKLMCAGVASVSEAGPTISRAPSPTRRA
jgi:hypothetical protein